MTSTPANGRSLSHPCPFPHHDGSPNVGEDLQPILDESLRTAVAVSDTDMGLLSLGDADGRCLEVGAGLGFDDAFLKAVRWVPPGGGACGTCFERRQRVVVEDTETDPIFADYRDAARRAGFRSVHSTPLITRDGRILGVLSTHAREPHRPSERETRLMDLCARQAADAIENAWLYRLAREEIAERRRVEQLLERYRLLSQHARDIVLFIRPDGRIAEANDAAVAAYGYGREELLNLTIFDLRDPATAHLVPSQMFEADATGITFETSHRRKDGSTFPVEVSSRGAEVGGERMLLSLIRDATARKRVEEAVRRSETRYRKLFEESALAIQVFSPDGRLARANRAWERLWGARLEQLADYNLLFDPQLEALGVMPLIRRVFAGEVTEFPPTTYVPDRGLFAGQRRSVRSFMYPVKDDAGRVEEVVLLQEDITEQTEAMEALKEADRRKDEFLAMLAHELRNPLAPVRNALHILRLPGASAEMHSQAREMAERQVAHMARLIDDLLEVSRVTRGKIALRNEPTDLAAVVTRAAEATMPAVNARQHELRLSLPRVPVRLKADPSRLEQVLVNLLTNAAKYTPPGGTIWLSADRDGDAAVVRVRDTGVGIAAELLDKVFDLFVQAEQGPDRTQGGLGIGLTLVKSLVELHGGAVEARSAGPGKGSEFTVRLPLTGSAAERADDAPKATKPRVRSRRVLVVDDNRDSAESLALLLRLQGHEVSTANDGPAALAAAGAFLPEVVLLDLGLPGMDGYEVARRLRASADGARALLVAVTGYGQEEDRRRTADAGFDHHLVKPPDVAAVERIVSG